MVAKRKNRVKLVRVVCLMHEGIQFYHELSLESDFCQQKKHGISILLDASHPYIEKTVPTVDKKIHFTLFAHQLQRPALEPRNDNLRNKQTMKMILHLHKIRKLNEETHESMKIN